MYFYDFIILLVTDQKVLKYYLRFTYLILIILNKKWNHKPFQSSEINFLNTTPIVCVYFFPKSLCTCLLKCNSLLSMWSISLISKFFILHTAHTGFIQAHYCHSAIHLNICTRNSHSCVSCRPQQTPALHRHLWAARRSAVCCPSDWRWPCRSNRPGPLKGGSPAWPHTDTDRHCYKRTDLCSDCPTEKILNTH